MPARGYHACAFGATPDEQFGLAAPFLKTGLSRGERALYMAHETDLRGVKRALTSLAVPLKTAKRSGVELLTCEDAGLARLPFSPRGTIERWEKVTDDATARGYSGLRVVVEMTWALYGGLDRLAEYEALSGALFMERPISALCLYNRLRFSEQVLRDAVLTHPDLDVEGEIAANPDYLPCDAFLARREAGAQRPRPAGAKRSSKSAEKNSRQP